MSATSTQLPLRTRLATSAGLAAASLSRRLGRGEGSVVGGRIALAIDPTSLEHLAAGRNIALVSGTNGKTTTTSLLVAALETSAPVVTNGAGSNMFGGMVSALAMSPERNVVLEVDEGHLPKTLEATQAGFVVLLNLSRDQLDRVGEVRMQAQKWREALTRSTAVVVANADDPMVVWSAETASKVIWVAAGNGWRLDAASCPNCGSRIEWRSVDWNCSHCPLRRPHPHARFGSDAGKISEAPSLRLAVDLKLPGQVNRCNAALALTTAVLMGAHPLPALDAVNRAEGAGGRFLSTAIAGVPVRLILAKNPAGWTEALRITNPESAPVVVAINARVQDGRDPSWLWDVPFEQLRDRLVVATGDRGRDLAVRLHYAEVAHKFVGDLRQAVLAASQEAGGKEVDVLGNYSAFQDFRRLVGE